MIFNIRFAAHLESSFVLSGKNYSGNLGILFPLHLAALPQLVEGLPELGHGVILAPGVEVDVGEERRYVVCQGRHLEG